MPQPMSRGSLRKPLLLILLITLSLSLSGCIFLRLNAFRKQMANFKEYAEFTIEKRHPVIHFTKPVLHVSDVAWLGGRPPSLTIGKEKKNYTATWRLVKLYPQERKPETENYDFDITLNAKNKKVHRLEMPVRFREIINEEVMSLFFDKADEADIEKTQSSAMWSMKNSSILPGMRDIINVCGLPYSYESNKTEVSINYKYHLVPPVTEKNPDPDSIDASVTLTYRNSNKGFLRSKAVIGKIHFTNVSDNNGAFKVRFRRK